MDNNYLNQISKHFHYLEELPIAASVVSIGTKEVLFGNKLFNDMVKIKSVIKFSELPDCETISKSIIKINTDLQGVNLLTNARQINISGENVLLCTHEDLSNIECGVFTASFIKIDTDKELVLNEKNKAIDTCMSIIKSSVRKTDSLIKLNESEYIIAFPKCKAEIVENIMASITKKVDVFNEISDSDYRLLLEFNVTEYTDKNLMDFINEYEI